MAVLDENADKRGFSGNAPFVPYQIYLTGHLEHERQIAQCIERITAIMTDFSELKSTIKDTNIKITEHVGKEDVTWQKFENKLTTVCADMARGSQIVISYETLAKVFIPTVASALMLLWYAKILLGY